MKIRKASWEWKWIPRATGAHGIISTGDYKNYSTHSNCFSRKQNDIQIWKIALLKVMSTLKQIKQVVGLFMLYLNSSSPHELIQGYTWQFRKVLREIMSVNFEKSWKGGGAGWEWEDIAPVIKMQEWIKMTRWFQYYGLNLISTRRNSRVIMEMPC